MKKKYIYLDYAATTPLDIKVFAKMKPYFSEKFGNPMSLHWPGREAHSAVTNSREIIARFFGCRPSEIYFTSGATESNNTAIKGVIFQLYLRNIFTQRIKPHIITTEIEHSCVLNAVKNLVNLNLSEATFVKPKKDGVVSTGDVLKEIRPNTALVSVMYVNNEIGTLQPISQIGAEISKINSSRKKENKIIFHTDATQAINYFDCNVNNLNVDILSMSAHKIYGPKGIGVLFVKNGIILMPILHGGGHERAMRSGTLNVPAIIGMGEAIRLCQKKRKVEFKKIKNIRDYIIDELKKRIRGVKINGSLKKRSPNNINLTISGVEGEGLLLMLDSMGFAVSTGSACSSGNLKSSHVLKSIGLSDAECHGSIRITLGRMTMKKDAEKFIEALVKSTNTLRKYAGSSINNKYNFK